MDGTAIKRARRLLGWSQARLADQLGTDPVTISRWERGVSRPRPSAQKRLRALLPVPNPPRRRVTFAADPSRRLADVDRARREQLRLRRAARIAR